MGKIREGLELTRSSFGRQWLRKTFRKRLSSRHESVCLRRDMDVPFTPPPAKVPLVVRQLRPDDDLSMIADEPGLSPEVSKLRSDQRWLLTCDLPTPWVAIDPEGKVCFMTFLLTAQDNGRIRALWGDWLPQLKPDEAIIEGSFTSENHRGLGIMPDAGTRIAEQGRQFGVRYGLGFILFGNTQSRRAGQKAGWVPFLTREEKWFLFRQRVSIYPFVDAAD